MKKTEKARTIKAAIIVDLMGSGNMTAEDEIEEHKRHFTKLFKPAKVKFYQAFSPYEGDRHVQPGTDLIIYDYGGMMPGTGDLLNSNSRELIKFAQNHPSSLVVVVSGFTYRHYIESEMKEQGFENLSNVVCDDASQDDPIPQWFRDQIAPPASSCERCHKAGDKIRCTECGKHVCSECLIRAGATICADCAKGFKAVRLPEFPSPFITMPSSGSAAGSSKKPRTSRRGSFTVGMAPVGGVLPDMKFFEPTKAFITWMKKTYKPGTVIYDVGAGVGHVSKMLADAGFTKVVAIDTVLRENPEYDITPADASNFPFERGSVVLIARPCHGHFVTNVLGQAFSRYTAAVLYVGLPKNVEADLDDELCEYERVLARAGKDGEAVYRRIHPNA